MRNYRDTIESQSTVIQTRKMCAEAVETEKQLQSMKPMCASDRLRLRFPPKFIHALRYMNTKIFKCIYINDSLYNLESTCYHIYTILIDITMNDYITLPLYVLPINDIKGFFYICIEYK